VDTKMSEYRCGYESKGQLVAAVAKYMRRRKEDRKRLLIVDESDGRRNCMFSFQLPNASDPKRGEKGERWRSSTIPIPPSLLYSTSRCDLDVLRRSDHTRRSGRVGHLRVLVMSVLSLLLSIRPTSIVVISRSRLAAGRRVRPLHRSSRGCAGAVFGSGTSRHTAGNSALIMLARRHGHCVPPPHSYTSWSDG